MARRPARPPRPAAPAPGPLARGPARTAQGGHTQPPPDHVGWGAQATAHRHGCHLHGCESGRSGSQREPLRVTDLWLEVVLQLDMPCRCGVPEFAERVLDDRLRRVGPARGEGTGHNAPANPAGLPQRRDRIRQMAETEGSADNIEGSVGERQVDRVGDNRRHESTRFDRGQCAACARRCRRQPPDSLRRRSPRDRRRRCPPEVEHPGPRQRERHSREHRLGESTVEHVGPQRPGGGRSVVRQADRFGSRTPALHSRPPVHQTLMSACVRSRPGPTSWSTPRTAWCRRRLATALQSAGDHGSARVDRTRPTRVQRWTPTGRPPSPPPRSPT